jgi:type IV pilus assembly protein PilA
MPTLKRGDRKMIKLNNKKGFTLIELMIVIAIIGILAAIAIPNFIAYRNKAFCKAAESDANNLAAAVADYFAIPIHVNTPLIDELNNGQGFTFTSHGTTTNHGDIAGTDPNLGITITVTDGSGRCPSEYYTKVPGWGGTLTFTKRIEP